MIKKNVAASSEPFLLHFLRFGAVYLFLLACLLLDLQLAPFFYEFTIQATFILPAIYYLGVFRPAFIPPWLLFLMGLLQDLLTGLPLGIRSLLFITVYSLAKYQRIYFAGQSFMILWAGYIVLTGILGCGTYLLLSLLLWHLLPVYDFMFEILLMITIFPLMLPFLGLLNKMLPPMGSKSKSLN